jgi:crossover junction endodeoxyribonuclease RuvC
MHVAGIDWSLTKIGVRVFRSDGSTSGALVESKPLGSTLDSRLTRTRSAVRRTLAAALVGYDKETDPLPLFLIEAPIYGNVNITDKVTGKLKPMGGGSHAHDRSGGWWLLVHLLAKEGLVVEVQNSTIKRYITTKGNASKDAVLAAAVKHFPHIDIADNNVADACALAAMGARRLGFPQELGKLNTIAESALDVVPWPQLVDRKTTE